MARDSKIGWCDHTVNYWTGCEHVSPACAGCYAESWAKRAGRVFNERRRTAKGTRGAIYDYQAEAARFEQEHGRKQRAFVNSLSDWADNQVEQEWRDEIFLHARECPDVILLLLTKRIGNALRMLPKDWGEGYPNVWIGSTVVTQAEAVRDIPKLLRVPAAVRFLSIEPMLEMMFLRSLALNERVRLDPLTGEVRVQAVPDDARAALGAGRDDFPIINGLPGNKIGWVIAGGESGPGARPSNVRWYRQLRDDCADAGVPFFFKQWGEWAPPEHVEDATRKLVDRHEYCEDSYVMRFGTKKTGNSIDGQLHEAFPS